MVVARSMMTFTVKVTNKLWSLSISFTYIYFVAPVLRWKFQFMAEFIFPTIPHSFRNSCRHAYTFITHLQIRYANTRRTVVWLAEL